MKGGINTWKTLWDKQRSVKKMVSKDICDRQQYNKVNNKVKKPLNQAKKAIWNKAFHNVDNMLGNARSKEA